MNERSVEGIRHLRTIIEGRPSTRNGLGDFLIRCMASSTDVTIHATWWEAEHQRGFVQNIDRDTLMREQSRQRVMRGYPYAGKALKPLEIDGELLVIRQREPIYVKRGGVAVTELVGIDIDDMHSIVGSRRVYGYAEDKRDPELVIPGDRRLN